MHNGMVERFTVFFFSAHFNSNTFQWSRDSLLSWRPFSCQISIFMPPPLFAHLTETAKRSKKLRNFEKRVKPPGVVVSSGTLRTPKVVAEQSAALRTQKLVPHLGCPSRLEPYRPQKAIGFHQKRNFEVFTQNIKNIQREY